MLRATNAQGCAASTCFAKVGSWIILSPGRIFPHSITLKEFPTQQLSSPLIILVSQGNKPV